MGRKPISASGLKRVKMSLAVTPAVKDALELAALEREISVSQVAMEVFTAWLKAEDRGSYPKREE